MPTDTIDDIQAAVRAGIAAGHAPKPAVFDTPDGRFICRGCGTKQPNDTCVGWVQAPRKADDPETATLGLVCSECYPQAKGGK